MLAERWCREDGADPGGSTRTWEENSWNTNSKIKILKPKIVNAQILQFLIILVLYYYLCSWVFFTPVGSLWQKAILWWVMLCVIPVPHSVTSSWQLGNGQGRCIYTMGISKCCEIALGLLFRGLPGLKRVLGKMLIIKCTSVLCLSLLYCDSTKLCIWKSLSDSAKKSLIPLTNKYSSDICLHFPLLSYSLM